MIWRELNLGGNNVARWTALVLGAVMLSSPLRADYNDGLRAFESRDYAAAFVEWRASAAQGDPKSQYMLGRLYEQGSGVPRNFVQAYAWYNLAASKGLAEAVEARDRMEPKLTSAQLADAHKTTVKLVSQISGEQGRSSTQEAVVPDAGADEAERAMWNRIKDSTKLQDYHDFLERYPDGQFAPIAQDRVDYLTGARSATAAESKGTAQASGKASGTSVLTELPTGGGQGGSSDGEWRGKLSLAASVPRTRCSAALGMQMIVEGRVVTGKLHFVQGKGRNTNVMIVNFKGRLDDAGRLSAQGSNLSVAGAMSAQQHSLTGTWNESDIGCKGSFEVSRVE